MHKAASFHFLPYKSYKTLSCLVAFFALLMNLNTFAQKKIQVKILFSPNSDSLTAKQIPFTRKITDSLSFHNTLSQWRTDAHNKGFYAASIDTIWRKDTFYCATLHVGKPFVWLQLSKGNVPPLILDKVGFRQKKYQNSIFNINEANNLKERIIGYYENHGYPFASVQLDSILIQEEKIFAQLRLNKGKLIYFDGIKLSDDSVKIDPKFLEKYLALTPKSIFDFQKIKTLKNRLNELPYLQIVEDPFISFIDNKAKVELNVRKNRASRFDAVLGVLPATNTTPTATQNRLLITGTLNLDLQNALGKGERFIIDYQRIKAETQEIKVQGTYPYILNMNIGADASLNIFKSDTSFTNIKSNVGLQYLFSANNYVKLYWAQDLTNLGSFDTLDLINNRRLPERLDVDASAYGIEVVKQRLDYRYNPRRGWAIQLKSDIGTRIIRKNNAIASLRDDNNPSFDFGTLYDALALRSVRWQGNISLQYYIALLKQSTIKLQIQAAGLFTKTAPYQNEQYRIGGNRLLRGFNEASLFATRYAVFTTEYRFLFSQNSYFNVFSDVGYVDNHTIRTQITQYPMAFGAGMTFQTRAGLFSLSYALGRIPPLKFDVRSGKIHFGYVSLF